MVVIESTQPPDFASFANAAELEKKLFEAGYLAEEGLVAAAFLAVRMRRPLFLEGDPGVGKTAFAHAMATVLGAKQPIRLQCHDGIDASQALYDWNFPKQILTLRAASEGERIDVDTLYTRDFLVRRPILQALENSPAVLLIDEIDRAEDEFEACLLEVLESNAVSIPEIGTIRAEHAPLVVLTSNQTREVHDALKRRCLYHWIDHPDPEREVAILRRRVDGLSAELAEEIAAAMQRLRAVDGLTKCPGIAESIDLAHAVVQVGGESLTAEVVDATISTIGKHRDDLAQVRAELLPEQRGRS